MDSRFILLNVFFADGRVNVQHGAEKALKSPPEAIAIESEEKVSTEGGIVQEGEGRLVLDINFRAQFWCVFV